MDLISFDSPRSPDPEFTIPLKYHQLATIHRMSEMESPIYRSNGASVSTKIGILGDIPSSGKTLTILGHLQNAKSKQRRTEMRQSITSGTLFTVTRTIPVLENGISNLIIVPKNVYSQWVDELSKTSLKYYAVPHRLKKDAIKKIESGFDVILLPENRIAEFLPMNLDIIWHRVILDEADSIVIKDISVISYDFIWFITASFRNFAKFNHKNVKKIMGYLPYESLDYLTIVSNREFVKQSFSLPEPEFVKIKCYSPVYLSVLKNAIPENIMTMLNAGDYNTAITLLGGVIGSTENIFELVTKQLRCKLFRLGIEKSHALELGNSIETISKNITSTQERLDSIQEKLKNLEIENCAICVCPISTPIIVPCCSNVFCTQCLFEWLSRKSSCPYCRSAIDNKQLVLLSDKPVEKGKKSNVVTAQTSFLKEEQVKMLINEKPNGKFLVFTSSGDFDTCSNYLRNSGITFKLIKGSVTCISNTVKAFKSGEIKVLLINSMYNGAGINLEMATDVIIYNKMNPELEKQSIGRAQRFGRTSPLKVTYLLHDNEF